MSCTEPAPRISVIMGVYNVASISVFERAVASVLEQTERSLELVICDDGSTDQTWEILCAQRERDLRIQLVRSPKNEGLASALNRCIQASHGQLIARQDADDLSVPNRLACQAAFLALHPEIDFVGSNVALWDKRGIWGSRVFPPRPQPRDFLFTMPFVHGALLFRREALERAACYRVAPETRRAEDYDLLMRMYAQGMRGANLPEQLYQFCEDSAAQKRRKYRYRVEEAVVRWKGFRALRLGSGAFPYVLKPLVVGVFPQGLLIRLKRWFKIYRDPR